MSPLSFFKKQKKPFKVNILKNLVQNFSMGLTQQYQSIYITLLGADPIQLGLITSIGGVLNAAVTIPASHFANRRGIKKALLTSILITAIGYLIIGVSNDWFFTIPGLALTSMAWGMGMVACPMVCGYCLDSSERATGMQICDTVSALPRLFPAGAEDLPKPDAVITSTSIVSSPRLLKIFLEIISSIIDDTIISSRCYTFCLALIYSFCLFFSL